MSKHPYLKWLSIFYHQRRKIVLEKWNNRNTITKQMSEKKIHIKSSYKGSSLSFNEAQKFIKQENDRLHRFGEVYDHTFDERLVNSYLSPN